MMIRSALAMSLFLLATTRPIPGQVEITIDVPTSSSALPTFAPGAYTIIQGHPNAFIFVTPNASWDIPDGVSLTGVGLGGRFPVKIEAGAPGNYRMSAGIRVQNNTGALMTGFKIEADGVIPHPITQPAMFHVTNSIGVTLESCDILCFGRGVALQ